MTPGTLSIRVCCGVCHTGATVRSLTLCQARVELRRLSWLWDPKAGWVCPMPHCRMAVAAEKPAEAVGVGR